jgi:putative ABC transport system substrate-binding protein
MNTRRSMLLVLGATALTPRAVFSQAKQPILIGWLHTDSSELSGQYLSAFKEGLAALGWKDGAQVVIEVRWANGRVDRLPSLADELAGKDR